jgi:hypothetical protein
MGGVQVAISDRRAGAGQHGDYHLMPYSIPVALGVEPRLLNEWRAFMNRPLAQNFHEIVFELLPAFCGCVPVRFVPGAFLA